MPLLDLLGNTATNKGARVPEYLKYNAFRWLRDSGFNAMKYAVSNLTEASDQQVRRGLLEYANFESRYPGRDYVGILAFGHTKDDMWDLPQPIMSTPRFLAKIYMTIYGAPFVGALLILVAIQSRGRKSTTA